MVECFLCGLSDKEALVDVISEDGIKKICRDCLKKENLPVIKKAYFIESGKRQSVYERLSRAAGISPNKTRIKESYELKKQEENLRSLVDKNYLKGFQGLQVQDEDENLVRNFHWIMMRVRRLKHLSQKQLADAIFEPEAAIKMAEQGILPKDGYKLIRKIENYLGVSLMKRDENLEYKPIRKFGSEIKGIISQPPEIKEETKGTEIDFSSSEIKDLTIGDLRAMKKQKGFFGKLFGRERHEKEEKESPASEEKPEEKTEEEKSL